jgi:hypothetical protein
LYFFKIDVYTSIVLNFRKNKMISKYLLLLFIKVILRILSRKGIVCKSKHQDLIRDGEKLDDDSASTVFATDLSRQNGHSHFHNSSSNSASEQDTQSPAMFEGAHISAFARHGMQNDAIQQYISKQGTPVLYTREILNNAIRESASRQNAQGKATPAQFAREEDIRREASKRLSSMYTTKTEKRPSIASNLRQSNDTSSHDRIQFKALQQFQNIPQSNGRKETNSDKQQPLGKVKTIVVYTQRKGQANSPFSRSPEMQSPR